MPERHYRVVSLHIHEGQSEAFEGFERDAAKAMARYGGRIEKAVRLRLPDSGRTEDCPYEVHIVSFPDKAAFERYAGSKEAAALADRRAKIIAKTVTLEGREAGPYLADPKPERRPATTPRPVGLDR